MECWIDPFSLPTQKALEAIGRNLQQQYEVWQPRARYRLSLDPSIEETKKLCCSLRRNAKDERILFHYNGHGVPKPTPGGEIWVFNKNYTQYIPVSVYDIQTWLGSPCIFVYDCSNAGNILVAFDKFATQRDWEMMRDAKSAEAANGSAVKCIQLAACQPHEILPTSPDLPADLFTCCLTTPIEIALRWFVLHNDLGSKITSNMILKIPGKLADRRTPLGELNWIFTAITDTIAWNVLSPAMFQKLFRQDLMVAALFRNFLLADRIMRFYKCHPMSSPVLPETYRHPIWDAWDLAADQCLRQLPALLESEAAPAESTDPKSTSTTPVKKTEYKYSTFFAEQLSAFEVWLRKGPISRKPPQQLPIVLQVLLSQVHRLRALMLLSKFLDLGQWAVNLALSVGIFPYVLRLLQSPAGELKPVLVFIWAKILAVDPSCQNDLIKDNGYTYFINILSADNTNMPQISNLSEHRAMCAFILSVFCHNYRFGQQACLKTDLLQALVPHLEDKDPLLRQWACVCLSELWKGYTDAKWVAIGRKLPDMLAHMLNDQVTEVRAAAMAAVGTLFGDLEKTQPVLLIERKMAMFILKCHLDASALVRLELVVALSRFTQQYITHFVRVAQDLLEFEKKRSAATLDEPGNHSSVYTIVWKALLNLSVDPAKNIAQLASQVVDKIHYQLFMTSSSDPRVLQSLLPSLGSVNRPRPSSIAGMLPSGSTPSLQSHYNQQQLTHQNSQAIKRSTSFVTSLRNLAGLMVGSYGAQSETTPPQSTNGVSTLMRGALNQSGNVQHVGSPSLHAPSVYPTHAITVQSTFYEWSCAYFSEPQMRVPDVDDPGSVKFIERQWRRERNLKVIRETDVLYTYSSTGKFEEHIGNVQTDRPAHLSMFHSYEPLVVTADEQVISVYDWQTSTKVNTFSNDNPKGSRITSMQFINEEDVALLLAGSDDGLIRLYRKFDQPEVELVSAWRGLSDILPGSRGSGLHCKWQQSNGYLFVGGDSRVIKVWDAEEELCVQEMPTRSVSQVTGVSVDPSGIMLLVGFIDGSVKLYDRRLPPTECMIANFSESQSRVLQVAYVGYQHQEFLMGTANGDVMLWDIRQRARTLKIDAGITDVEINGFSIHEHGLLVGCGSNTQNIRVLNLMGETVGAIRYNEGFLQRQASPIHSLAFHPRRLVLAVNTATSVSFFKSNAQNFVSSF
ncbi:hypothetical protein BATDEDRAFT_15995 [Batrachochytrium dendrobatidis JAM81]|uniref:Raptor N-terminal CASPase-like domain-containing protein n=1 Tax=Batrachochytrium dendrobatidis (strain JAM81 / FGSC 10211) TaxID=684364 RepID=F4NYL5_BATDJ|nr:uncharacterized protein BATDEDRAFT_15995 [Batrachochytrium dendrobatidis JAM81]EGF82048.1 hypothetical protein BATDEDRAFT_15995 [Batrachochytrium dendrobatidis JAM81]|eukprot:XP_006677175.1 hypothetical protein BATDEDRAFT_15995 [Batrachochytrium dendrobatidis JAM81]